MKTLNVNLPGRSYDILMERGLLSRAGELCRAALPKASRLFVVTDSTVGPLYLNRIIPALENTGFETAICEIPAGEASKCVEQLSRLWECMMDFGLTRTDAVVALGGGVVGDLAGFAAATILRGVDFVQIPTTLLAQVDSSVGGKVAIDLQHGKNLAGAFWQPRLVLMDPAVLGTLDDKTFADGMAEVIKYGCIRDAAFLFWLEQHPSRQEIMADIEHVLYTCCDIKRSVVVEDERDTGARMVLNFGHTLGHAYELAGHYQTWTHGQAVAAGMVKAAELGVAMGITPAGLPERIGVLLGCFGLPVFIPCTHADYAAAIGLDKKGAGDSISVILLEEAGKAAAHLMPKAKLLEELK
ncbi:3-dehydroquinate synthase [Pseudoflavonifractor capillosus ATCC 29799]|uniref:3-dehydroquinate synthase n=1 Tax=Pseudoflavonifractor capillosus ATCC 29799 TaxID=411467 RepID=A6NXG4_9FIRM|nr:3-dehydroquinate synthase [Pseudoflavonifractor capillosus]EDM98984.1 3-dehydroquinate synthase [Pseudoflavonifractor capillosus ATCC 29799]